MSVILPLNPPVGIAVIFGVHRYDLVAVEPYSRTDGKQSNILIWEGLCLTCGAPFEIKTGLTIKEDQVRRCEKHRKRHVKTSPSMASADLQS